MDALADRIQPLIALQEGMRDLHPLLARLWPLALTSPEAFWVYEVAPGGVGYVFRARVAAVAPIPPDVCAALALPDYGGRTVVVADPALLQHDGGLARILVTMASAALQTGAERAVAERLGLKDLQACLNEPLPHAASDVDWLYTTYLDLLEGGASQERLADLRHALREMLGDAGWSQVVATEWRGGMLRWLRAAIRQRIGLPCDTARPAGWQHDTLAFGGALLVGRLIANGLPWPMPAEDVFEVIWRVGTAD